MATTKVSKGLIKDGAITIDKLNNTLVVTEAESIANNVNDLTVPTTAAVKDYVDAPVDNIHVKNYIELGDESLGGSNYLFKRNPFNLGFDLRLNDASLPPLWQIVTVNGNENTTTFNTDIEINADRKFTVGDGIYTTAPTLNLMAQTFINGRVDIIGDLFVSGSVYSDGGGGGGGITSIQAGSNITIDNTDPTSPLISASTGSGSAGALADLSDVQTIGYQGYALLPGAGISASSDQSTILGFNAAPSTTASGTTAFGNGALRNLTTGAANTGMGRGVMGGITTGGFNTAIGESSIVNHNGDFNVVIGYRALRKEIGDPLNSSDNVILGSYAASLASSGMTGNVIIGSYADSITGGSNNIIIGNQRFVDPVYSIGSQSNKISLGSNQIDGAYVNVAWTVVSDERDKMDFNPVTAGLDFVSKLEPVSYYRRKERGKDERAGVKKYGFKAQDILALEGDDPVIIDASNEDRLMYTESNLIPILVKAIQDLEKEIQILKSAL